MNAWIHQVFVSKIAKRGGIVRRKTTTIEKYASLDALEHQVKKSGFHIVEHGDQYIIFSNKTKIRMVY